MEDKRFAGGAVTVSMVPIKAAAERCVEVLQQHGLQARIEVDLPMAAGEALVVAGVPCDSKPTMQDVDAAKARVLEVLGRADIAVDFRAFGFQGARGGDRA